MLRPRLAWTGSFALCAAPASAQMHDLFGISVTGLGDVDGDGRPDLAVGDPAYPVKGEWSGRVWVISSADWRPLRAIDGAEGAHFGVTLASPGDLDGDGVDDLLVGSTQKDRHARVAAFSAATGELLYDLELPAADRMHVPWYSSARGPSLAAIGDVDEDGRGDFVVGVPLDDGAAPHAGLVQGRSEADGALLYELGGCADCDRFGISVAAVGDLDGDGAPGVAVASTFGDYLSSKPRASEPAATESDLELVQWRAPRVRAFSSASGSWIRTWGEEAGIESFGAQLLGMGDIDGDKVPDLIITSPQAIGGSEPDVALWSGASSVSLRHYHPSEWHWSDTHRGVCVARLGDLDGDGHRDVAIGAASIRSSIPGLLYVHSSASAEEIVRLSRAKLGATPR